MPEVSFESTRAAVFFILLFWLFIWPDNGPGALSAPSQALERILRQRHGLSVLNSTRWGDFSPHPRDISNNTDEDGEKGATYRYLNLTGFRKEDGYAWEDLGNFRDRCREWSENAYPSLASEDGDGKDYWNHDPIAATWHNASGTVRGHWVRRNGTATGRQAMGYNLTAIAPAIGWYGQHVDWHRNVTGDHGKIIIQLEEHGRNAEYEEGEEEEGGEKSADRHYSSAGLVRETTAMVTIEDEGTMTGGWSMRVHGVHWPRQGSLLLTTTSEKFAGIFGLPHLAPGPEFFKTSQKLLNRTIDETLYRKARMRFTDPSNPWTSNPDGVEDPSLMSPNCEYIMYIQLHPLGSLHAGTRQDVSLLIDDLERELRFPTGAPINDRGVPKLRMSVVAWSPDCSYYLESKGPPDFPIQDGEHLVGMKEEVFLYKVNTALLTLAAILMGQVYLFKMQMKESSTPSTIGRVSFQTGSIMLLADGLVFLASAVWSLSATTSFLPCLLVMLASFMSMMINAGFLGEIYKIQEPERRNREREQAASSSNTNTNNTAPTPAAAAAAAATSRATANTTTSPPIIIPSDQDIDAEILANTMAGATAILPAPATANRPQQRQPQRQEETTFSNIVGYYVPLVILIFFLSVAATTWRPSFRSFYMNTLSLLYLSLWVPQIWRNVQRNSRRALAWRFMVGQSVLRILPIAYFYLRTDNLVYAETDPYSFALLAGWVWIQLWVLAFQDVLGPRYGIPSSWVPEVWDYHPVLREDDVEAGGLGWLPIGLASSGSPTSPGDERDEDGAGYDDTSRTVTSPLMERGRSWLLSSYSSSSLSGRDGGVGGARERERDKDRERKRMTIRSIDCAICRETLEVPVARAGGSKGSTGLRSSADGAGAAESSLSLAGVLARRAYMVTPCRHIFHTKCLEGWLRFRLQCPICREELPPL